MRFRHIVFNPMWSDLQTLLANLEDEGWALSHVVAHNQYQSVAVLMKADDPSPEEKTGSYL